MARQRYVYIVASRSRALYTGVTGNLPRRVYEHKHKLVPGFTQAYNITRLVHYETTSDVRSAIAREKQIKGWSRAKKMALIKADNPSWADLSEGWYEDGISAKTADANAQRTAASAVRRGQRSEIPRGVYPEPTGILRGVYPEPSKIPRSARNDFWRGARNDFSRGGRNDGPWVSEGHLTDADDD